MAPRHRSLPRMAEALGDASADKRLEILRRVDAAGSISQAARDAGVSYKAAWQALDTLSNLAGATLVERVVGGAGGGGARLTAAGRKVLAAAADLAKARAAVAARLSAAGAPGSRMAAVSMRTSMRNHLPCEVATLTHEGAMMLVELSLPGGGSLSSLITRESAQLLSLRPGLPVLALFKATAVQVRSTGPIDARNVLSGAVTRGASSGGEVALTLGSGGRLVGFATRGERLRRGQRACAIVEPSAVVVALA